jgi:beta-lactamase regulating signal transducer with metallopeptidase domain
MTTPWNELHSLILYIVFGYTLLLPLVLVILKIFRITSPLQRLRLYLLAFLTPFASFILYHTLLAKRCEAGLPPVWAENTFHLLCIVSEGMLLAALPLAGLLLFLGTLKAAAAVLMIKRLERERHPVETVTVNRVTDALDKLCSSLQLKVPRVIFSGKDGIAAFTTGFYKPVLVVNSNLARILNEQELNVLLSHELIHIQNRDTVKSWLLHLLRDLSFINPLSNMLLKHYLLEKEALCDQKAARLVNQTPLDYAAALIKIWRSVLNNHRSPVFGLVSAFYGRGSGLERRVGALIQDQRGEGSLPSLATLLLGTFLFVTTMLFLGLVC